MFVQKSLRYFVKQRSKDFEHDRLTNADGSFINGGRYLVSSTACAVDTFIHFILIVNVKIGEQ
ncbi:hypothetical protein J23TS9_13420 [Paenibacillus sp. J23TS9]|nr:hypothetical protein J23TS9_13420 [Paenibacillus sp. J23TS9]